MGIQRKIYEANKALSYFVTNDWDFKNDNTANICRFLRLEDIKDFDFRSVFTYDVILAARNIVMGYRRFLMKEKDESLPQSRKMYQRQLIAVNIIRLLIYLTAFYFIFVKYDIIKIIQQLIGA